jgi:lipid-A-disaccharide synthase-like uncharacterized protein
LRINGKRIKWEPPFLMVLLMALGVWLVWSSGPQLHGLRPAPGARTLEFRLGNARGVIEDREIKSGSSPSAPSEHRFRVLLRNGFEGPELTADQFKAQYGVNVHDAVIQRTDNAFFRLFNITSWASLAWVAVGLLGQGAFFGRMFIQWILSERTKTSIVPPAFWWFSLIGGGALFVYFVWRQDFVGVLGQSTGVVIYARNLRLISKQKLREAAGEPASNTSPAS